MLNHRLAKTATAFGGWVLAITLMAVASIDQESYLRGWALLIALVAWIPTHSLIVGAAIQNAHDRTEEALRLERLRTEQLIQAVAVAFAENEVTRIGRGSSRPGVPTP